MVDVIGRLVCHQLPERSLTMGGRLLPICARCTGIYFGMFLAMAFIVINKRTKGNTPFTLIGATIIALSLLPMIFDGATSYVALRTTTNLIRVVTGGMFGVCIPLIYTLAFNFNIEEETPNTIVTVVEVVLLVLAAALFGVLFHAGVLTSWAAVSAMVCFAIIMVFVGIAALCYKRIGLFFMT